VKRFERLLSQNYPSRNEIKRGKEKRPGPQTDPTTMASRFKELFSRDVKVHFVGAWCFQVSYSPFSA